ncbi:MAG: PKD domain-containing protein [Ferruginibacter sp.]
MPSFQLLFIRYASLLAVCLSGIVAAAQLDTSLVALDNPVSCGMGTQVRLLAGLAANYQWTRNGSPIAGATSRQYSASISGAYRVRVSDASGNVDSSRFIQVYIVPNPTVDFSVNQLSQCLSGNLFQFTNTSTISQGTLSYVWYYGDGAFELVPNGTHTYTTVGTYNVKLVATSNYGCVGKDSLNVIVNAVPTASFSINSAAQCINTNHFSFANTSTVPNTPTTFLWRLGDGNTTTAPQPLHQYAQAGSYTVRLVVTTQSGCKDSVMQAVTVHPKPTVNFSINNSRQCSAGNFFQFTNLSSIASGALIHSWSFGDGATSNALSSSHSYLSTGNFPVKLIETSNNGCVDSLVLSVVVDPSPSAAFSVNQQSSCFQGNQFSFTNQSSVSSGNLQYYWDFGDGTGTSNALNPTYSYAQSGTYRVTLLVRTDLNCESAFTRDILVKPTPSGSILTPPATVICDGSSVQLQATSAFSHQWYRNGLVISGATASTLMANEPGVYHVIFSNMLGCASLPSNAITLTKVISPIPSFVVDRSCASLPITFTNNSAISNSLPVSYSWDFGDGGATATQVSPLHTYANSGTYTVQLIITPLQCLDLARSVVQILTIQEPLPGMRYTPVNAIAGRNIALQAREFSAGSYQWSPTAGLSQSTVSSPIFNHSDSVLYQINIVTDAGCRLTDTLLVRIFTEKRIFVPDYFTPNGDGMNDRIAPFLVGINKLNRFRVWNRWGQLLYQGNAEGSWDGYYRGVLQPMETYVWTAEGVDVDGKVYSARGSFILIR